MIYMRRVAFFFFFVLRRMGKNEAYVRTTPAFLLDPPGDPDKKSISTLSFVNQFLSTLALPGMYDMHQVNMSCHSCRVSFQLICIAV